MWCSRGVTDTEQPPLFSSLKKLSVHWGQGEVKVCFLRAKPPWSRRPLLQMIS